MNFELILDLTLDLTLDLYFQDLGEEMSCCNVEITKAKKAAPPVLGASLSIGKLFRREKDSSDVVCLKCEDGCVKFSKSEPCRPVVYSQAEMRDDCVTSYGFDKCYVIDGEYTLSVVERN